MNAAEQPPSRPPPEDVEDTVYAHLYRGVEHGPELFLEGGETPGSEDRKRTEPASEGIARPALLRRLSAAAFLSSKRSPGAPSVRTRGTERRSRGRLDWSLAALASVLLALALVGSLTSGRGGDHKAVKLSRGGAHAPPPPATTTAKAGSQRVQLAPSAQGRRRKKSLDHARAKSTSKRSRGKSSSTRTYVVRNEQCATGCVVVGPQTTAPGYGAPVSGYVVEGSPSLP
jgi:hypothetical protein